MTPKSNYILGGNGVQAGDTLHYHSSYLPSGMADPVSMSASAPLEPGLTMPHAKSKSAMGVMRFSLFGRTYFLLVLLLICAVAAWVKTIAALESRQHNVQVAKQLASIINITRAALDSSDAQARSKLIAKLTQTEGVLVKPRTGSEAVQLFDKNSPMLDLARPLQSLSEPKLTLARSVDQQAGLWVGFASGQEQFWLQTEPERFAVSTTGHWLPWLIFSLLISLTGAALMARWINRPMKALSFAASRVRDGDFQASRLSEDAVTSEIREVNTGFNRMTERLAKIEHDRAIMLAGISHDLRTPLARLRLETEMSVIDESARHHMVADLEQLDAIIDKFLDYARPSDQQRQRAVSLNTVIQACVQAVAQTPYLQIRTDLPQQFFVMGDEVELSRVVSNLVENARKYGKTAGTNLTRLVIAARERDGWVLLKIRDHGEGVQTDTLKHMTKPFFRGDVARTAATGAGLGLAIVDKTIGRMGGSFSLHNSATGGLVANIRLPAAPPSEAA